MSNFGTRRWREGSIFGQGERVPLDREQRAQFKAKIWLQRCPKRLTLAAARVGESLLNMLGMDGRLDPSIATIAAKARVSVAATKEALKQLRAYGFLTWQRRLVRSSTTGWRCEQASNAYQLRLPACEATSKPEVRPKRLYKRYPELTDRENAARLLLALGAPIPAEWRIDKDLLTKGA